MIAHDFEDWLIGLSLLIAVSLPLTLQLLSAPLAGEAIAAVSNEPAYRVTVVAKRVPAACKGLNLAAAPADCRAYLSGETTMTMDARE